MEVKPVKKETLTEQIMNQLAEQITSGELAPGERLPDERSLAEMFGVTRSRIREALRALSLIGLIDIRPGGGSFVAEQSAQIPRETILWSYHREISDYENLYDARKLIEGTVYLSCFYRRTDEVVDMLQDYADKLFSLDTNEVSGEAFCQLIDEIDTYVGANCGNGIYDKLMQTMIVLRHDSALQILSMPTSKESAILWRVKVLKSFAQDDRSRVVSNIDGFFANSISQLTTE